MVRLPPGHARGYVIPVATQRDTFRDETIPAAIDRAIAGDRAPLIDKLRRASGLPGVRINDGLVRAFAAEAARRGQSIDPLATAFTSTREDVAPYGHVDEILPILGVAALGARAAADAKARRKILEQLEEASCDGRFRVRDQVAQALAAMTASLGADMVVTLGAWLDDEQPFLGRAASVALADREALAALSPEDASGLADKALARVEREHRAGRRHTAYRDLCRALPATLVAMVLRHATVADTLDAWAAREDEDMRAALADAAKTLSKGAQAQRGAALSDALAASAKKPRDPRHGRLPGKRGRGNR